MADQWSAFPAIDDRRALDEAVNLAAGHRNALDGRVVDIACWLLAHDDWKGEGLSKPEQYLAFRCGMSPATARRYVDVARRADELPQSVDALRRGELALDQLMPIVRRVPSWADGQVLSLARRLTVGQITACINKYDFERSGPPDDPGADTAEPCDDARDGSCSSHDSDADDSERNQRADRPVEPADRCWYGTGDDGRWRLHIETSAETGMAIEAAIRDDRDRAFRHGGNAVSDVEALAAACRRSVDTIDEPARRERYRTNIHLNTDGRATDQFGQPLPDAIARHITCDGRLTPVFHRNGTPISVGRAQRIVPERTRKEVLRRDGGCRVPGCTSRHHLEIHHVIHWSDNGPTSTWNLVALCPHHHRMHHHGRLGISGDADDEHGLTFTNSRGVDIAKTGARPTAPTGPPPAPSGEYVKPLGERLDMNWVAFSHPERRRRNAERIARDVYRRALAHGTVLDPAIVARYGLDAPR